jgi:signal transduction histidine kinase
VKRKQHHPPTVPLCDFIEQHRRTIVEEWIEFARTLTPWAKGLSRKALRDHAEELLSAIVADMKSSQSGHQQSEKAKGHDRGGTLCGVGKKHAIDRLEGGLKLDQLVSEFRALRASVLRLWDQTERDHKREIIRFNEAIDETLAESALWYTQKMAQTREHFHDILGHDLRNPLNSIVVGATLLTTSEAIDGKVLGDATRSLHSADRMERRVSDLLDLTRTRLGVGIPVTPKPMDLAPVCQQAVAELEAVHPDCQLHLESHGDLHGEWDSDRLTQAISNLVANALQYRCEGGAVKVVVQAHADDVVLRVHNDGPPISEDAMKKIFEPMNRQPAQHGEKHAAGLGLGLYIAREIVTAHGGTIAVASAEQKGTTFTVQLPRRLSKKRASVRS